MRLGRAQEQASGPKASTEGVFAHRRAKPKEIRSQAMPRLGRQNPSRPALLHPTDGNFEQEGLTRRTTSSQSGSSAPQNNEHFSRPCILLYPTSWPGLTSPQPDKPHAHLLLPSVWGNVTDNCVLPAHTSSSICDGEHSLSLGQNSMWELQQDYHIIQLQIFPS